MAPFELDLQRLRRLVLRHKGGLAGIGSGKRLSNRFGASLEFADYRPYLPGDDIRRIDWSLYGRSRRLYTRLNRSELDATVNIAIDCSASMAWGDWGKKLRSLALAYALAYISIRADDRISLAVGAKAVDSYLPPVHGQPALSRIEEFLARQQFEREGDLSTLLFSLQRRLRPRQVTVIISDFLSDWQPGLTKVARSRQQLLVFLVTSPDELEPKWRGPLSLVDSETGARQEVELNPFSLAAYQREAAAYRQGIASFCRLRGIDFYEYDVAIEPVTFLASIASKLFKTV